MCFEHDDKKLCGVGVIAEKALSKLKIKVVNKIDKFVLTTCHREIDIDEPDKGIFRRNGRMRYIIRPTIERDRGCPFYFATFGKNGKHSWGILAIKSDKYLLKANLFCNGSFTKVEGVAICQSRENLLQKIVFEEPVIAAKPTNGPAQRKEDCPVLALAKDGFTLEYKNPNRECLYGFIGRKSGKEFQFYTVGYERLKVN